jgi:hypothetical protein
MSSIVYIQSLRASYFKIATKNICILYCTQLVSTTVVPQDVSEHDARPAIYFGGPRLRALGVDHMFGLCQELGSVMEA